MRTPTLLDQLSQAAREDQEAMKRLDERWGRLASGELSEAEHDELRGLADATGEGYEAYQAFKPLGPAFQQNVAAAILAQQERERDLAAEATAAEASLAALKKMDSPAPREVPERRGIFKWAGALAATTTLAAGLLLFAPRGLGPAYLDVQGHNGKETRSSGAAVQDGKDILESGKEFEIILRSQDRIEEDLEAKAFIYQNGVLIELPGSWSESGGGNFILEGNFPYFAELKDGDAELIAIYYRPDSGPTVSEIRASAEGQPAAARDWRGDKESVELRNHPAEPEK